MGLLQQVRGATPVGNGCGIVGGATPVGEGCDILDGLLQQWRGAGWWVVRDKSRGGCQFVGRGDNYTEMSGCSMVGGAALLSLVGGAALHEVVGWGMVGGAPVAGIGGF